MATRRYGKTWVFKGKVYRWEYRASRRRMVELRGSKHIVRGPWEFNPHSRTWQLTQRKNR